MKGAGVILPKDSSNPSSCSKKGPKTVRSDGCNLCEVCGGKERRVVTSIEQNLSVPRYNSNLYRKNNRAVSEKRIKMPTEYKRKGSVCREEWSEQDLQQAVEAVQEGRVGVREAVRYFAIHNTSTMLEKWQS
ncbi:unnamed protein product [Acanthoscelides obtectus]|uniref:Uncharacterized protein n=1 Tax=Acanthoscelides obtectus TaxID=200917 RepID=A0A9P0PTL7_ACAOB|nr:unnamed protein product [Acanthoscelides obtectus]CAK1680291.1 hypothetical protein AOBTE_LOCUS32563 [Acanthoscelides obtectus]